MALGPYSTVTEVKSTPAPAGGDGLKIVMGTCVGSDDYDTGGSTIDLSSIFSGKVYFCDANCDVEGVRFQWVPGTLYAAATGKLFADNNNGTELSSGDDISTTCAVIEWLAIGTDA